MANNSDRINVNIDFTANISSFNNSLNAMKSGLSKLKVGDGLKDSFSKTFDKLESEIENFQKLTSSGKMDLVSLKEIEKSKSRIESLFSTLKSGFSSVKLKDTPLTAYSKQVDTLKSKFADFNKSIQTSEASAKVDSLTKHFTQQEAAIEKASAKLDSYMSKLAEITNSEVGKAYGDVESYMTKQIETQAAKGKISKYATFQDKTGRVDVSAAVESGVFDNNSKLQAQVSVLKANADTAKQIGTDIVNTVKEVERASANYNKATGLGETLRKELDEAKTALSTFKASEFKKFIQDISQSADVQGIDIDWTKILDVDDYTAAINKLQQEGNTEGAKVLANLAENATKGGQAVKAAGTQIASGAADLQKLTEQQADVDRLYSSLTQFFSISSGINLFKRAISGAYDAIKELDSAMTEVAVVTDFTVGDMWEQLPEYTAKANELGVAISQVYDAAALYYQQGLNTTQVNSLIDSTLQMARIASLDATVATDRMTNAFRGFNMEINSTNAQHISDVYSELAAKTASDVDELSTAMTKTASIAASANMSFENTAAFLAQGIETTRESADTIGTMLKTVIGRFTEVKEAWTTGELTAEIDGEEINLNKASQALRTAGINLNDFFTGAKGLDEIFIELSSKWNDLDLVQQRYIATQAAGSRQQSRFIALMQDYERQQELIGYAYNADGAAQMQYEKTLESLETKLSQLKNAWDVFTMGIANNGAVKTGIDMLTNLITVLNNLTSTLGSTGSMIANIGLGVGGFFGGKKLISGVFKNVVGTYMNYGQQSGRNFLSGFKDIFTPSAWANVIKGDGSQSLTTNLFKDFSKEAQLQINKGIQNIDFGHMKDTYQSQLLHVFGQSGMTGDQILDQFKNSSNLQIKGIAESSADLREFAANLEKARDAAANAGQSTAAFDLTLSNMGRTANSAIKATQTLSAGLTMAAVAVSAIGQQFAAAGDVETAEAFSNIATAIGLVGAALTVAIPAVQAFGISIETAFAPLLVISGIVIAAVAAFNIWDSQVETSAEKTERLNDTLLLSQEAASGAKQAYEELQDSITSFEDTQGALDDLVEGTDEFKTALIAANQQVLELLDTYPQLSSYLTTNKYGGLTIDSEGLDQLTEWQTKAAFNAETGNLVAQYASLEQSKTQNTQSVEEWFDWFTGLYASVGQQDEIERVIETAVKTYADRGAADADMNIVDYVYRAMENAEGLQVIDFQIMGDTIKSQLSDIIAAIENRNNSNEELNLQQEALLSSILKSGLTEQDKQSEYAAAADYYSKGEGQQQLLDKADAIYKSITSGDGNSNTQGIMALANELKTGKYGAITAENASAYITDTSGGLETYKQIYRAILGHETDSTDISVISSAISQALSAYDFTDDASKLIQGLENFSSRGIKEENIANTLRDLYGGTLGENVVKHFDEVINGWSDEQLKALAELHGYGEDIDGFKNSIGVLAKELEQQYTEQRESLGLATAELGMGDDYKTTTMVTRLSIEDVQIADNIFSSISENFSGAVATDLGAKLKDAIGVVAPSGFSEGFEQLKWIQDLDFSNAVDSAQQLRDKVAEINKFGENATSTQNKVKAVYEAMLASSTLDEAAQVKQVYSELSDDLDDLAKSSDGITASGIKELATSGSNLAKVLQNDKISVNGLAKAFSALKSGQVSINGITTRVLEATSKILSMDASLQEAFDTLSAFDGFDRGEGLDTIKGWSDKVKEYIDNFEYGNASDYLGEFFTNFDETVSGIIENGSIEELENYIYEAGSRLQNLTSNDGYNALLEAASSGEKISQYLVKDGGDGFSFLLEKIEAENVSYDELIGYLAESLGVQDSVAEAIIGTYASRDEAFKAEMERMTFDDAIESFVNSATTGEGNTHGIVTSEEVAAIAAATNRSIEEIKGSISGKLTVLDLVDEDGMALDTAQIHTNFMNALSQAFKVSEDEMNLRDVLGQLNIDTSPILGTNTIAIDTTSAISSLENLGFSLDQAQSELETLASDTNVTLSTTVQIPKELENGEYEITEVTITGDSLAEIEAETQALLNKSFSETLATELSKQEFTFVISEDTKTSVDEISTKIKELAEDHVINLGNEKIEEAITKTADLVNDLATENKVNLDSSDIDSAIVKASSLQIAINSAAQNLANLQAAAAQATNTSSGSSSKSGKKGAGSLYGTAYARGTGHTSKTETALVGEMGQEIVVTKDGWYTVGNNGPEFTNIPAGSVIFNAKQTQDLLTKGETNTRGRAWLQGNAYINGRARWNLTDPVPNYYDSTPTETAASAAESAEEATEEAAEIWINTLDKLYNLVEKIEEETRRREILEKKYEQLLRNQSLTIYQIRDNYEAQLESLDKQLAYQQELQSGRLAQINNIGNEKYEQDGAITTYAATGATGYARYNQSTNTIEIDWDRIDNIVDKNLGDAVNSYIDRLEELQDQFEDTYEELINIEDEIYSLNQVYREQYEEFSQRIYDALVQIEQDRINSLQSMYNQLTQDNTTILDALREQVELERQIRDNTEKEKEIAETERELAYLRRDTSSGNLAEIKKLEQELADLREAYADDLIDQKLDNLQDDNEKAAAQRDMQIEQLNAILEYNQEHGAFWGNVESLITSAFNSSGELSLTSDLVKKLKETEGFKAMSDVAKDTWSKEFAAAFQISAKGLENWKVEDANQKAKSGEQTSITLGNGATVTYDASTGKWKAGSVLYDLTYDATTGKYGVKKYKDLAATPVTPAQTQTSPYSGVNWDLARRYYDNVNRGRYGDGSARDAAALRDGINAASGKMGQYALNALYMRGIGFDDFKNRVLSGTSPSSFGGTYHFSNYTAFKEGGLADFTGPAWLDGTKAHPELVLNAKDTENFMVLKDVLSDSLNKATTTSNNRGGDNYFDIQIQVDELASDYDVEQLTNKIKDEIKKDSMYRNVNTLNFLR